MLVEVLRIKGIAQLRASTAEITRLSVGPGFIERTFSKPVVDSMKTITLGRLDSHLVERVAQKVASSTARLAARLNKFISVGINAVVTKGSEKVAYQGRGRRPRCSHGYRFDDVTRHCDCGKFRSGPSTTPSFKAPSRKTGLTKQPQ